MGQPKKCQRFKIEAILRYEDGSTEGVNTVLNTDGGMACALAYLDEMAESNGGVITRQAISVIGDADAPTPPPPTKAYTYKPYVAPLRLDDDKAPLETVDFQWRYPSTFDIGTEWESSNANT